MNPYPAMRQRALHIVLAFALVLFSWTELSHASDLQAHLDDQGCEFCLFASPLGHGATPAGTALLSSGLDHAAPQQAALPARPASYHHAPAPRGPPPHS